MSTSVLRKLRQTKGLSIRQMSQAINAADSVISGVELRRRTAWPRLRAALAQILDSNAADLFETTGLAKVDTALAAVTSTDLRGGHCDNSNDSEGKKDARYA